MRNGNVGRRVKWLRVAVDEVGLTNILECGFSLCEIVREQPLSSPSFHKLRKKVPTQGVEEMEARTYTF